MSINLYWMLNLAISIGVYTLLAVSLNLINGYAGMFHLGHHGFWAMGAYGAAWLTVTAQGSMPGPMLYAVSLVFAVIVAAIGGLAIGIPCLRLRGDYLAIATLATLPGGEVDTRILAMLPNAKGKMVPLLIEVVGQRRIDATPTLLSVLDHSDSAVRSAALRAHRL